MAENRGLETEIVDQFQATQDKLNAQDLPELARLLREKARVELTDDNAPVVIAAALRLAAADAHSTPQFRAALAGARGYLLLGEPPTESEARDIEKVNSSRPTPYGSQPFRFSWARWQELREQHGNKTVVTEERSGRMRRLIYASAATQAMQTALERPWDLLAEMRDEVSHHSWSRDLDAFIAASRAYLGEIGIDPALHVERSIERQLASDLLDPAHPWPRAIVGEAGAGKSTLLWALHRHIEAAGTWLPVLVGAPWLIDYLERNSTQSLVDLLLESRAAGRPPVLLVDTVDLMLHDDATRQPLLRLLQALGVAGIVGIYSTRPQEAALLTHDDLRRVDLAPYDDNELAGAVTALVARYSPQASAASVLEKVRVAQARGLPVDDVCRSPLLLRMLFDLGSPEEPELADMDVTRLFAAYWERRIVRDARSETDVRQRTRSTTDLSSVAGRVGIGLLASGLPELPEATLRDVSTTAGMDVERVGEAVDVLLERGVLERAGERVGFFHQTMFEFAAAKGLLSRGNATALTLMAERTSANAGDLFVGSVLEQTLILAGENPLMQEAARTAIDKLVVSELPALESIALAAWAHYPSLLDVSRDRLRYISHEGAERAARMIPAIAGKDAGTAVSQLLRLWSRRSAPNVAIAVLEGLNRIALRSPEDVSEALDYLDPVESLVQDDAPGDVWQSLHRLLRTLAATAPRLVRATLVATLTRAQAGRRALELENLAEAWSAIGDENLLGEVARAVEAADPADLNAAPALGKILALEWTREGDVDAPERALKDFDQTHGGAELGLLDAARYSAVGAYLTTELGDRDAASLLLDLLDTGRPEARDWVSHHVLHDVLSAPEPAATLVRRVIAAELATVGADAQRGQLSARQILILEALTQSQLPPGLLVSIIPRHLQRNDWMANHRLLRLAPLAAADGHERARELLRQIAHDPSRFRAADLDALFSTLAAKNVPDERTHDAMVTIAFRADRVRDLTAMISSAPRRGANIQSRVRELLDYSRQLLASEVERERANGAAVLASLMAQVDLTMDWPSLSAVLESVGSHPQVLAPLIKNLWQQTPPGEVAPQLEFLNRYVRIDPASTPPVARTSPDVAVQIAVAAAEAYLRILGLRADWDPDAWPRIYALTLYELDSSEIHVSGMRFVIACDYLQRTGSTRPRDAARHLVRLLEGVAEGEFVGLDPILWHRELRNAIQYALSGNSASLIRTLTGLCVRLDDPDLVEVIVRTLAETDYAHARDDLHRLVPSLRRDASKRVLEIVRTHDRSFGTRAFPEIAFIAK